ncbi:hypothetical protein [Nocardia brasiliensis]|uniref:hypothetical protein n=1 Tax=Nocardia brasiliensis TaxID=37326 RepID=UPI0036715CE4
MTEEEVHDPPAELAGWKSRLLDRIEVLAARHERVLRTEYPRYRDGDGRGSAVLEGWRSRLRDLDAIRSELELRAELAGVHLELIEAAREGGNEGDHWYHRARNAPAVRADDRGRAPLLDAIAEDMWTLEHMAAVEVARHDSPRRFTPNSAVQQQYERNMVALWTRVNTTAATAELTEAEHTEMLRRGQEAWIQVFFRTVYGHRDAHIQERWYSYAWPGIEWDANRASVNVLDDPDGHTESRARVPGPGELISEAARALHVGIDEARFAVFLLGDEALAHPVLTSKSSPSGPDAANWGSEPVDEALVQPPEFGTSA